MFSLNGLFLRSPRAAPRPPHARKEENGPALVRREPRLNRVSRAIVGFTKTPGRDQASQFRAKQIGTPKDAIGAAHIRHITWARLLARFGLRGRKAQRIQTICRMLFGGPIYHRGRFHIGKDSRQLWQVAG